MKQTLSRHSAKVTLFAAVLLATCLSARPANAQSDFQGKFTLPYETRWGKAVLPAGDYSLTFIHGSTDTMLAVRNAKSQRVVAFESVNIREDSGEGNSALLIGGRGKQRIVHSFRIAELGETFVYDPALAHGRVKEEVRNTQTVPVIVAKK